MINLLTKDPDPNRKKKDAPSSSPSSSEAHSFTLEDVLCDGLLYNDITQISDMISEGNITSKVSDGDDFINDALFLILEQNEL